MSTNAAIIRRPKIIITPTTLNLIHRRNPLVIAWWSLCYPGFGHLACGSMGKGIFVFIGELIINYMAKINMAILYSFTGKFAMAKTVLDTRWLLIYCGILVFSIWDSYRIAVEINKVTVLADRENAPITPTIIGSYSINSLLQRTPWVSLLWSLIAPGMSQLYNTQAIKAIFLFLVSTSILVLSHALEAIHFTALGNFVQAKAVIDWQWFLNIPSFYVYTLWDSYSSTVELNKLFEIEQAQFFRNNFQNSAFHYPV